MLARRRISMERCDADVFLSDDIFRNIDFDLPVSMADDMPCGVTEQSVTENIFSLHISAPRRPCCAACSPPSVMTAAAGLVSVLMRHRQMAEDTAALMRHCGPFGGRRLADIVTTVVYKAIVGEWLTPSHIIKWRKMVIGVSHACHRLMVVLHLLNFIDIISLVARHLPVLTPVRAD